MCYAGGVAISEKMTLRFATSYSYFSSINKSYNKNNPDISGFWCVAKAWKF